jgi:2-desacetyl-2-hydroxyethyl bacteriochlorophyllide A dehydrogenase
MNMTLMKAGSVLSPGKAQIVERPIPQPDGDQVLIKLKYAGICGTDLKIYDGTIPYLEQGLLSYPVIPGHEWSGEVVKVGANVRRIQPGDRVTGECHIGCGRCDDCLQGRYNRCADRVRVGILGHDGGFAEYIVIPEKAVHILPGDVSYRDGCLTEPLTVALYALDRLEKLSGSHVLVLGLGPIGLLVCQAARAMGAASITGVDLDEYRRRLGLQYGGCDQVADGSAERLQTMLKAITGNHGIDVVVEASGAASLIHQALQWVRPGGQVSLVGLYKGSTEIDANLIVTKDIRLIGNMASPRVWERALRLMNSRRVNPASIVTHTFPFEQWPAALEAAYKRQGNPIKVIIQFEEGVM